MGGYELRCKETVDELRRRGHEVFVLTSSSTTDSRRADRHVWRELVSEPSNHLLGARDEGCFRILRRYDQMRQALGVRKNYRITRELELALNPELAFVWNLGFIGVTPVLACQDADIPVIFSIGDYGLIHLKSRLAGGDAPLKRKYWELIEGLPRFSQLNLAHLLLVSNRLREAYTEAGFPEQNMLVIPRGIPSEILVDAAAANNNTLSQSREKRLLFVGRIVSEKAPDVAIHALAKLQSMPGAPPVRLDIVGDGPQSYLSNLRHLVSSLKLDKSVSFLGRLEHSAVIDLYSHYDALLFPSRWEEPLAGTILEAMARGLAVIASTRGGTPEIISDGENGLLVPADDPGAMAGAILRLTENSGLAQRLRFQAVRTIRERFALERVVDQTLAIMEAVLTTRPGPSRSTRGVFSR